MSNDRMTTSIARSSSSSSSDNIYSDPQSDGFDSDSNTNEMSVRSEEFQFDMLSIINDQTKTTEMLCREAFELTLRLNGSHLNHPEWLKKCRGLGFHKVLESLIDSAPTPGGKRYIAASICACYRQDDSDRQTIAKVHNLAITFYTHLLAPCQ